MPEDNQSNQGMTNAQQGAATAVTADSTNSGDSSVVIDPNKSAEQYIKDIEGKYIVPSLVRNKFGDLVKLIYETESMNQEEREYWLQIMPIMSEEQIVKFREILVNEKEQLARLDQEYQSEMSKINRKSPPPIDEAKVKAKMEQIEKAEAKSEEQDAKEEENLLDQLDDL